VLWTVHSDVLFRPLYVWVCSAVSHAKYHSFTGSNIYTGRIVLARTFCYLLPSPILEWVSGLSPVIGFCVAGVASFMSIRFLIRFI
jgi:hypothetical protein